jgi:hypothetical protein
MEITVGRREHKEFTAHGIHVFPVHEMPSVVPEMKCQ